MWKSSAIWGWHYKLPGVKSLVGRENRDKEGGEITFPDC